MIGPKVLINIDAHGPQGSGKSLAISAMKQGLKECGLFIVEDGGFSKEMNGQERQQITLQLKTSRL